MSQTIQRAQVPPGATPFDPHGGRLWTPPILADRRNARVTPLVGEATTVESEAGIIAAVGHWVNFEVWCDVPASWLEVELVLRQQIGESWAELDRARPVDIEHLTPTPGSSAGVLDAVAPTGRIQGLLFGSYGRAPMNQLSVHAVRRTSAAQGGELSDGNFWIRAWGTEGAAVGDRVGRPIYDRWATRRQNVRYTNADLLKDGNPDVVFAPPSPRNEAIHVTDVSITVTDPGANPNELVTLQLLEPAGVVTIDVATWRVGSSSPVRENLAIPYTGRRGWTWQLQRTAPIVVDMAAAINGYIA